MAKPIYGFEIGEKLHEAGLIPDNTKRIVIDIKHDNPVIVYYETYGNAAMVELCIEELIKNKSRLKVIKADKKQDKTFHCNMIDTEYYTDYVAGPALGQKEKVILSV